MGSCMGGAGGGGGADGGGGAGGGGAGGGRGRGAKTVGKAERELCSHGVQLRAKM